MKKTKAIACKSCHYCGERRRVSRGSSIIEFAIWFVTLLILSTIWTFGLIGGWELFMLCFVGPSAWYSVWRLRRYTICRCCGSRDIIPLDSPLGKEIAASGQDGTTKAIAALFLMTACACNAQLERMGFIYNGTPSEPRPVIKQPVDPIRVVNGVTNSIKAEGWVRFSGKVIGVHKDGFRVLGYCDRTGSSAMPEETEFFVTHFPHEVADGDNLSFSDSWMAKEAGTYRYTTVLGGPRTLRKLDYGKPVKVGPRLETAQERIARADARDAQRKAAAETVLKYWEPRAATNDAYAQFRLGEIYRDGAGVDKDLVKARALFEKAAASGQTDASNALQRLP